jgi:hypothetical protein
MAKSLLQSHFCYLFQYSLVKKIEIAQKIKELILLDNSKKAFILSPRPTKNLTNTMIVDFSIIFLL